ncbi:MAG TPA: GNAT family N-acetyltransferase [Candidatus Limnocylindrales bacterium]|nr:GNAT family N-acetyltransferase [Candidatus Limnocylindrales bacterium]
MAAPPPRPTATGIAYRRAEADDLVACAGIWRDSINDYTRRLNQPDIPDDLAAILRLYGHLHATDPEGFVVAERAVDGGPPVVVAFAASVRREELWFLSMLFVLPDVQAVGLGRALLAKVMPSPGTAALATCTDSAQPISNALYASLGMTPRMPLVRLVGLPERDDHLPALPRGISAVPFGELDGPAAAHLDDELAALDRATAGFGHLQDHGLVRAEGRIGVLFVDGGGQAVGYGYASEAGRVGPVAMLDPELLAPAIGHLVTTIVPRGAFGIWMPGAAGVAMTALLRSGFRMDGFPCLVCWDRPLADFSRYVPISPGLL